MSTAPAADLGTQSSTTTAVYKVYIKTTPEAIWEAISSPEWSLKYGYGGHVHYDLQPGGALRVLADDEMKGYAKAAGFDLPDPILDGEVLEVDPPKRLRTTWRMLMDPTTAAEGFTTLTYDIEPLASGYCALTVTHECPDAPATLAMVTGANDAPPDQGGGGWPWILSDLKTLLETGSRM